MLDFPRWKTISISLILALGVLMAIPSLLPAGAAKYYPSFLPQEKINLGAPSRGEARQSLRYRPEGCGVVDDCDQPAL